MNDTITREHEDLCELVTAACVLVERRAGASIGDEATIAEATLLAAELGSWAEQVDDEQLAADAAGAAGELAELIARQESLLPRAHAMAS